MFISTEIGNGIFILDFKLTFLTPVCYVRFRLNVTNDYIVDRCSPKSMFVLQYIPR